MKSLTLQIILIVASVLFLAFIINLVRTRKLSLQYALVWLLMGLFLTLIAIFPGILFGITDLLTIKEPVNTIFLITIFFLLIILLSFTISISKHNERIKKLTQELAILKEEKEDDNE